MLANPPRRGLVPHRWGCIIPVVMVWAPEVPPGPHPLVDMDSSLTYTNTLTHTIILYKSKSKYKIIKKNVMKCYPNLKVSKLFSASSEFQRNGELIKNE